MLSPRHFGSSELDRLYSHLDEMQLECAIDDENETLEQQQAPKEDTLQIKSSYWKIESPQNHRRHSAELSKLSCLSLDDDMVAIGSTADTDNLKIYSLDAESTWMTHLSTISLPDIQSTQWLYKPTDGDDLAGFRFLFTGHTHGIVNLTMIPVGEDAGISNAQIIKRFNHEKHIHDKSDMFQLANNNKPTNVVYQLEVTPRQWKSSNKNSLLSIYKEHVFLWDSTRSRAPVLKNKVKGVSSFAADPKSDGLLALSGSFGISLFDMRSRVQSGFSSSIYIPDEKKQEYTLVNWCKEDSNYLCSADVNDNITIWDIRRMKPLSLLSSHSDSITSMQWESRDSMFSASKDGTVVYWDLSSLNLAGSESTVKCTTRNSMNTDVTYSEIGTSIPVSNHSVVAMTSMGNGAMLTLDECFLGLHQKTSLQRTNSSSTLVGAQVDPFLVSHKTPPLNLMKSSFDSRKSSTPSTAVSSAPSAPASSHDSSLSPKTLVDFSFNLPYKYM